MSVLGLAFAALALVVYRSLFVAAGEKSRRPQPH
jgi:hypothetical protein